MAGSRFPYTLKDGSMIWITDEIAAKIASGEIDLEKEPTKEDKERNERIAKLFALLVYGNDEEKKLAKIELETIQNNRRSSPKPTPPKDPSEMQLGTVTINRKDRMQTVAFCRTCKKVFFLSIGDSIKCPECANNLYVSSYSRADWKLGFRDYYLSKWKANSFPLEEPKQLFCPYCREIVDSGITLKCPHCLSQLQPIELNWISWKSFKDYKDLQERLIEEWEEEYSPLD